MGLWRLSQFGVALLALSVLCSPNFGFAGEVTLVDGVRYVKNGAEPARGQRTLHLEPIWRVNVEEEEVLIGVITAVLAGPAGTTWLADHQLGQVFVYSAQGEYLRSLSREGEGPGEVRSPDGLLWLPDNSLGITDSKPGKITQLDPDGTPKSSLHLKLADGEPMGASQLSEAQFLAGTLAICGTEFRFGNGAPTQNRFFGIYDLAGSEVCRLWEAPTGFDFEARTYDELKNYFVDRGTWTIDKSGRVHFAPERNHYVIHVHDAEGQLEQVYERQYSLWRRSSAEKAEAAAGASMRINGEPVEIQSKVDDFAPAIATIETGADGNIWVLPSHGTREQTEGVFRTYDIFDADGHFQEVVRLAVDIDDEKDRLHRLADGRWIILRNIISALESMYADYREDATEELSTEEEALEIVCLRAVAQ